MLLGSEAASDLENPADRSIKIQLVAQSPETTQAKWAQL